MKKSLPSTCPKCKSNKFTVKLPDLIFVKTRSINLENTTDEVNQREISDIELINQLMLPPAPRKNTGFGIWRILLFVFGLYLFLGFSCSFFSILNYLLELWETNVPKFLSASQIQNYQMIILMIAMFLVLGVILISLTVSGTLTTLYFVLINKLNKKITTEAELNYPIEKQKWDAAKEIWINLYYCSHDNIVFKPDTKQCVIPEETRDLIYNQAENG